MQQTTLTAWALPYDLTLFYTWYRAGLSEDYQYDTRLAMAIALAAWVVFTKCTKLMPHFVRHPEDTVLLLPVVVVFGYVHGLIKLWGLVTLNAVSLAQPPPPVPMPPVYPAPPQLALVQSLTPPSQTTWGSRPAADTDDAIRMERPRAQAGIAQSDPEKSLQCLLPK